jgi:ubiquinol-cytochrome c reductase cytochrome b subunit
MFHQKHTQMPALRNTALNVTGQPFFPYFLLKGQAWFFFIFATLVLLATFAQVNPVWLYGPYTPLAISSASQPDFYMGILEGSLRMMPAWEINFLGHTVSLSVLIPGLLIIGAFFTLAALWPFFEQWATGDKKFHHINDRPRNAPARTAAGVAVMCFYGILWAEGANDVLADRFDLPLYTITWISRFAIFIVPIGAYFVTKRVCLGLQRRDAEMLSHGVEIGIIRQLPSGAFVEESRPLTGEERAVAESAHIIEELATPAEADANGLPEPAARSPLGWARTFANRAFTETARERERHDDGDSDAEAEADEPAFLGAGAASGDSRAGEQLPGGPRGG